MGRSQKVILQPVLQATPLLAAYSRVGISSALFTALERAPLLLRAVARHRRTELLLPSGFR